MLMEYIFAWEEKIAKDEDLSMPWASESFDCEVDQMPYTTTAYASHLPPLSQPTHLQHASRQEACKRPAKVTLCSILFGIIGIILAWRKVLTNHIRYLIWKKYWAEGLLISVENSGDGDLRAGRINIELYFQPITTLISVLWRTRKHI